MVIRPIASREYPLRGLLDCTHVAHRRCGGDGVVAVVTASVIPVPSEYVPRLLASLGRVDRLERSILLVPQSE